MDTLNNAKVILNTVYILFLLAILALGLVAMPKKANAASCPGSIPDGYICIVGYGQGNQSYYGSNYQMPPLYVQPQTSATSTSTPTVYSNSTNPNTATAKKTVVAQAKTTKKTSATTSDNSNLTANTISSSNSFMPSGFIQWIFLAILVLLIVILVRRIYGGNEKYHATPMKHK
jgi:hypothetical protein